MVTFELIDADRLEYAYFPEGKGRAGYMVFSKKGDDLENFTLSPDDNWRTYLIMAFNKVRKIYKETGNFPKEGMSAWY